MISISISIQNAKLEWQRYKDPSEEPDANSECDMNTFISLTSELEAKDTSSAMEIVRRIRFFCTTLTLTLT